MAIQSVSQQVPVPTVTHKNSSFAGKVQLAETAKLFGLGAKYIDLRQFADFRKQVWGVKQVKGTETTKALSTLQQGQRKKIHPQEQKFYSTSANLMDASDNATANMQSTALKRLTHNENSVVVRERDVEVRRGYDGNIEVLATSGNHSCTFQVIDKAKAHHYVSSDEFSKNVRQITYLLRADNGTEKSNKKNEVAFVTFINGFPNPPDTECLSVNRSRSFPTKSTTPPSVSAQGTSTTSKPLTSTQPSPAVTLSTVPQVTPTPVNNAPTNSTPTTTGNFGIIKDN